MTPSNDKQIAENAARIARNSLEIEGITMSDDLAKEAASLSEKDRADGKSDKDFKDFVSNQSL